MRSPADPKGRKTRRELILLFVASFAAVSVLTLGTTGSVPVGSAGRGIEQIAVLGFVAGLAALAVVFAWR